MPKSTNVDRRKKKKKKKKAPTQENNIAQGIARGVSPIVALRPFLLTPFNGMMLSVLQLASLSPSPFLLLG